MSVNAAILEELIAQLDYLRRRAAQAARDSAVLAQLVEDAYQKAKLL